MDNFNDVFTYDVTSPSCLVWKIDKDWNRAGKPCGTLNKYNKQWHVHFNGKPVPVHRLIWKEFTGEDDVIVYHLNGDSSDNRIENLSSRPMVNQSCATLAAKKRDWKLIFNYDPNLIQIFRWNQDCYSGNNGSVLVAKKGDPLHVYEDKDGYLITGVGISSNKSSNRIHRMVYEYFNGEIPDKMQIDHIDGNILNNKIENLRLVKSAINSRNKKLVTSRNRSGINGVNHRITRNNEYWRATWVDLNGKDREKNYSVLKYGYDRAFELACEFRKMIIDELNKQGAGYTERHGEIKE